MRWQVAHRYDPFSRALADRHYSRRKVGDPQFVPPGRNVVLSASGPDGGAVWSTVWQKHVLHAWPGAWMNSLFRNEGAGLSSELIREAVAATRYFWPDVPDLGMITFVDAGKVRRKRDPGRCYI